MRSKEFLRIKNLPAKCLLAFLLFFSFITIAGYCINARDINWQAFKVELLYSFKDKSANETALFRRYFPKINKTPLHSRKHNLFNLIVWNRLVKIKASIFEKKSHLTPIINWLLKSRTAAQTSDENAFPSSAA
jgi:hypothetical protein